jgi:adenosylmethionine-8-amino-7-oxononanoate aminotransferase
MSAVDYRKIKSRILGFGDISLNPLHLWLPYTQMKTAPAPLRAVRTEGVHIFLDDGRRLVDGIASWWTACHGYNHPHIRAAVNEQLASMPHVMLGGIVHGPAERLAARLAACLPGDLDYCFFSESGSVAVEVAMKMAIQYWLNRGERGRTRMLSFRGAYHGDTFAAMSVCDPEEGMHQRFAGVLAPQAVVDLPRTHADLELFDAFLARHPNEFAAMIVEPLVQAAGGFRFHSADALRAVVESARRHGLLVIFDEIATGFGRTGSMFACDEAGVVPDIITLSKALTGGTMPLAATVSRRGVFEAFLDDAPEAALMHGPTFCGNPLGCAAANASLDLFEHEPRLAQVARIEAQLRDELEVCRGMPGISDVRVKGAIGVVELEEPPDHVRLRAAYVDAGAWIRPFGKFVYVMPALTIDSEQLSFLTRTLSSVLVAQLR